MYRNTLMKTPNESAQYREIPCHDVEKFVAATSVILRNGLKGEKCRPALIKRYRIRNG